MLIVIQGIVIWITGIIVVHALRRWYRSRQAQKSKLGRLLRLEKVKDKSLR